MQVQEILEGAKVLEWLREHAVIQYVTRWEKIKKSFYHKRKYWRGDATAQNFVSPW